MKLSQFKCDALYSAIHTPILDVRVALRLTPEADVKLAQIEHDIWRRVRVALNIEERVK